MTLLATNLFGQTSPPATPKTAGLCLMAALPTGAANSVSVLTRNCRGRRSCRLRQGRRLRLLWGIVAISGNIGSRSLAVWAFAGLASCSSKPVDCNQVAPSDCPRYSECLSIEASWLDEQCVLRSYPLACWPMNHPLCEMNFFVQGPAGQCWLVTECVVPAGWQEEDGSCTAAANANYNACYPQDAGIAADGGRADGGV